MSPQTRTAPHDGGSIQEILPTGTIVSHVKTATVYHLPLRRVRRSHNMSAVTQVVFLPPFGPTPSTSVTLQIGAYQETTVERTVSGDPGLSNPSVCYIVDPSCRGVQEHSSQVSLLYGTFK